MHLVHNSDKNPNSLAVISALFEIQNNTNTNLENLLIPFKYLSSKPIEKSIKYSIQQIFIIYLFYLNR